MLIRESCRAHLLDRGFGWRSTAEALRLDVKPEEGISVLAGYITRMACHADQTHGELAKLTQVPTSVPTLGPTTAGTEAFRVEAVARHRLSAASIPAGRPQ